MSASEGLSPAKRALLARKLRERRAAAGAVTIPRRSDGGPVPLSYSQQRMWFLQQWEPDAPTFNGARAFTLRGPLDVTALRRAFERVLERHESLRTVVVPGREPTQAVLTQWSLALPVLELSRDLESTLRALSREPFDLTADLMLRATLLAVGPEEHVLLVRMHHIAADAHSDRVLFSELSHAYARLRVGAEVALPELPIQYADFAVWQRAYLQGAELARLTAYWGRQLEGVPTLLALPTDRPRQAVQRHEGAHHRIALPRDVGQTLLELGRGEGVTFFMTMLAAFSTLLYLVTGEEDIVIGSPIANRNHVELAGLIGFFTNTMALRVRLRGNPSFREVLGRARETALGAYAHQDLPFERVVEIVAPKRDPSHNPLFVVNFRAQESERPALTLDGLQVTPVAVDIGFSRFDLALELELRPDVLTGYIEYDQDLFNPQTAAGLEEDLSALLGQVVADPDIRVLSIQLPHWRRGSTRRRGAGAIARRVPK